MNSKLQMIALLAQWDGWLAITDNTFGALVGVKPDGNGHGSIELLPNYTEDLNAISVLELKLSDAQASHYGGLIHELTFDDSEDVNLECYRHATASPLQRCEALIKAITQ